MKKLIPILIIFSFIIIKPQDRNAVSQITKESLIKTVSILSSKEYDGRLPGSEGYDKAAKFVSNKFLEMKLKPFGDAGYFQFLNVEYNRIDTPVVFEAIIDSETIIYKYGKDFVLRGFSGANSFTLPVAFCGYGISRPDLGYDDYQNVNVKNKIVIVFKQNPKWKIDDKDWGTAYPREKSLVAKQKGAKGILFVSLPNDEKPQPLIGSVMHGEGEQPTVFPQIHISIESANKLLSKVGLTLSECQTKIDEKKKPFSFLTRTKAKVIATTYYQKEAKTMNVVALLEGNDPILKNEYVVIGAHLDHVGSQAGLLFPGANDNASGSAGVLEIAKAFVADKVKPKRSIIFVSFASEEQGLNGSKHFVENLKVPEEKIVAMLNLDCIGYGDSIQVGNGKSSPKLWQIAKDFDEKNFKLMVSDTWSGGGADATPFHEKGIPSLYFVSKYSYDHLHLPTDTVETLNPDLFEKIVRLAFLTSKQIADGNYEREDVR
ncbi:Putative aminopeptidase [Ignavibacterium album JCM 16511]|uniref:Putative aminopeptidase n=1 Tax=Ignavibacterium album (strain DSM 19864 / JCM 16511 / NBRC 101810 / Mat9-16) TaxID=945713 RepID=I0API5_IGNAJ|nr:M20/M25/M40 family metallo-hydrolase [Ignavibacterium album]AFH50892.1 Putative aminopeptidase [Ignavibacterium album JCM 16511]